MAVPANEYTSYEVIGVKEDVSDIITNISPTKTPFQSVIGNEKVTQKLFQWQEDSLAPASGTNAQVEGDDASFDQATPTVMRSNITQIFRKTVSVSGTLDVTSTYGRARESAYQMAKRSAEIKRDLEVSLVGVGYQAANAGSNAATPVARKMASFLGQLPVFPGNGGATTYGTAGSYYDHIKFTGGGPLAESITPTATNVGGLLEALQEAYDNGAEPNTVSVVPARAITVAGFALSAKDPNGNAGAVRIRDGGSSTTLVNVVTLYKSPFGDVKVVINRFQTGSPLSAAPAAPVHTYIYEPSMWTKATLRSWTREALAKTGDSTKQMLLGEFSLKHKNFKASAAIIESTAPVAATDMAVAATYNTKATS